MLKDLKKHISFKKPMTFYYGAFYSTLKLSIHNINLIYKSLFKRFICQAYKIHARRLHLLLPAPALGVVGLWYLFWYQIPWDFQQSKNFIYTQISGTDTALHEQLKILRARTCQQQTLMSNIHHLLSPLPIQCLPSTQKRAAFCCGYTKGRLGQKKKKKKETIKIEEKKRGI